MDRVGYRSGDIVAVRRNPEPGEGEVVIARIGQEITLKCFHRAGRNRIELQPRSSNPEHKPIVIDKTTRTGRSSGRRRGDDRSAANSRMLTSCRGRCIQYR